MKVACHFTATGFSGKVSQQSGKISHPTENVLQQTKKIIANWKRFTANWKNFKANWKNFNPFGVKLQSTNNEIDDFCSPNSKLNFLDKTSIWFPLECNFWSLKLEFIFFKNENFLLSSWKYQSNRVVRCYTTQDPCDRANVEVHVTSISEVYLLQIHSGGIRPSGLFQKCSKLFPQFLAGCSEFSFCLSRVFSNVPVMNFRFEDEWMRSITWLSIENI